VTRARFRELAQAAIEYVCGLPEDLWEDGVCPMVILGLEDEEVVVGLRERNKESRDG
jgi:hypothetical protein